MIRFYGSTLFAALAAGALVVAGPLAAADSVPTDLGFNADEPIAVNADRFAADLNAETGTYSGNVLVVQGAVRMRADEVKIDAPSGRATRMEARGSIVVESPSGTATGALAVYDIDAQLVRLTGDVVLTNNENVMRGSMLEVRIADGRATLTGGVAANGQAPGSSRVQGLFVPPGNNDN
jgi:lipopolysaccharide export system protein LptA